MECVGNFKCAMRSVSSLLNSLGRTADSRSPATISGKALNHRQPFSMGIEWKTVRVGSHSNSIRALPSVIGRVLNTRRKLCRSRAARISSTVEANQQRHLSCSSALTRWQQRSRFSAITRMFSRSCSIFSPCIRPGQTRPEESPLSRCRLLLASRPRHTSD